ncbi:MAG: HEAT repeat domain-containing protein [Myxococcales bacterium]
MTDASPLDSALEDLASGKRRRQAAGHEAIMQMAEGSVWKDQLVARLPELASHPNPQVRGTAYLALAMALGKEALPVLQAHVDEREGDARLDLAQALAAIGEPALELLRRFVKDPIFEVRFAAAGGLVPLGDPAAADVLLEALGHSDVRYLALSALQRLADPRALEPARRLFQKRFLSGYERIAAAGVLARLGDTAGRRWLVERVARRKGADRGLAIEIVGELGIAEAVPALLEAIGDRNDPFRGACVRVLGMLGDGAHRALIEKALFDSTEEVEVRMDAAEGLMNLGGAEARSALERALDSTDDEELREVVREAIAQLELTKGGGPGEGE